MKQLGGMRHDHALPEEVKAKSKLEGGKGSGAWGGGERGRGGGGRPQVTSAQEEKMDASRYGILNPKP